MMEKGWNSNSTLRNSAQFEIVLGNHWERKKLWTIDTLKVDKLGDAMLAQVRKDVTR